MTVQHLKKSANIPISAASQVAPLISVESAFRGELDSIDLPVATQSLLQSKDLITTNTSQATESLDSVASCVCGIEKKKQRIGVRLTIAERKALETAAKQNNVTLSGLISRFAQNFAHQKSA